jgi:hypothetical protein
MNVPESVKRVDIAAFVLFTAEPTDRALAGWGAADWLEEERRALTAYARAATTEETG